MNSLPTLSFHDSRLDEAHRELDAGRVATFTGLTGNARFLLPLLATDKPILFVAPHERAVETAVEDLLTLAREAGQAGPVSPFPAPGPAPFRRLPRHPEAMLRRAAALDAAIRGGWRAVVASPSGLLRPVLAPRLFATRIVSLAVGDEMTPEIVIEALDEGGYCRDDPVTAPGQMARRGGILDFFPPDRGGPVRIEFFGDTIESLRLFDPETQRTTQTLQTIEILPLSDVFLTRSLTAALKERLTARFGSHREVSILIEKLERGLALDEIGEQLALVPGALVPAWEYWGQAVIAVVEPEAALQQADLFYERARADFAGRERTGSLLPSPEEIFPSPPQFRCFLSRTPALHVREVDPESRGQIFESRPVRRYSGDLRALLTDLKTHPGKTLLLLGSAGRAARVTDLLRDEAIAAGPTEAIEVRVGTLSRGFELIEPSLRLLADGDVFPEEVHFHARRPGRGARSFLSDFRDLRTGDMVVHDDHGIGRFEGLETLEVAGVRCDFMVLSYQGGDKLKIPVDAFDRVQKYSSVEGVRPRLDRLGSGSFDRVKRRVKRAMRDMAAELLRLYAERKTRPGHSFAVDSPWIREFDEAFEYETTPDQAQAIADVIADLSTATPMDRLICGDVGYGKTEVAMRAAMRTALDGKQVAVLAPTTVLAFQHWKTFGRRFAPFPIRIEMISRFRSRREIGEVLTAVTEGRVDVLIGTHRLLSKDVVFRDLGLLVIDEEQRFGVAAKERLKRLKVSVDCLTLSATPIPRTLQMGLTGIRDMSVIETPPKDRLSIQTSIVKFSTDVIAAAIRQELARDGQVYCVHNRVESIYSLASLVQRLVPEARVIAAHGQMPDAELERAMLTFVEGRADVLVTTTIIENGLDIPRVNTLLINRADRFGLAQLYQLRGRVGRSDRRAYAYLLVPPGTVLSEIARRRLAAIQEFSDLGAGFRIAALDLELRGAGNLLGGEQSGHIQAVGLDLYIKLLEQSILELKGEAAPEGARATLNLRADLRIPDGYVPDVNQRMAIYKRISQTRHPGELASLETELRDRYGPLPDAVAFLLRYAELRLRAERIGLLQVDLVAGTLHLRFGQGTAVTPNALLALIREERGSSLAPEGILRVPLSGSNSLNGLDRILDRLERNLGDGHRAVL